MRVRESECESESEGEGESRSKVKVSVKEDGGAIEVCAHSTRENFPIIVLVCARD